jgi:hypothetical protein
MHGMKLGKNPRAKKAKVAGGLECISPPCPCVGSAHAWKWAIIGSTVMNSGVNTLALDKPQAPDQPSRGWIGFIALPRLTPWAIIGGYPAASNKF